MDNLQPICLIPYPRYIKITGNGYPIKEIRLFQNNYPEKDYIFLSTYLKKKLQGYCGIIFEPRQAAQQYILSFSLDQNLPQEAYKLVVTNNRICLWGGAQKGLFYAIQSLIQIIKWAFYHNSGYLPLLEIEDEPQYSWRGLHLDVSRHFFSVDFIKQYLDWMAELKLNRFHWHLTDDQGWRIESKFFPLLTEIGAWRIEKDGSRYGGFYTQEDIQEIVAYASDRCIEVVPEIDIPGHALGILAAYPHLSCHGRTVQVWNEWGVSTDILCAGKQENLSFLKTLLSEIAELFPSKFLHLGGDEVPKKNWEKCPNCQKVIKDKHLKDADALQGWLLKQVSIHLRNLGKTVIGWDEVLDTQPDSEIVIMIWRGDGTKTAKLATQSGNSYILCPNPYLYFDWKPTDREGEKGAFGVTTLEKVYHYNPSDAVFDQPHLLLGAQANVWTERMLCPEDVRYMLFPRIYALAEIVWTTPTNKDWQSFLQRVKFMEKSICSDIPRTLS